VNTPPTYYDAERFAKSFERAAAKEAATYPEPRSTRLPAPGASRDLRHTVFQAGESLVRDWMQAHTADLTLARSHQHLLVETVPSCLHATVPSTPEQERKLRAEMDHAALVARVHEAWARLVIDVPDLMSALADMVAVHEACQAKVLTAFGRAWLHGDHAWRLIVPVLTAEEMVGPLLDAEQRLLGLVQMPATTGTGGRELLEGGGSA
jgi:tryptophan 2,3-dioxygenase